jgi:hypothetical protein
MNARLLRLLRMQVDDFLDGAEQTLAQAGLPTTRWTIKIYTVVIAAVLACAIALSVSR